MLLDLFHKVVSKYKNEIAVKDTYSFISYNKLNLESDKIANHLLKNYPLSHKTVILLCTRSINSIISLIGIIKAACRYIPIEWTNNLEEIQKLIDIVSYDAIIFADNDSQRCINLKSANLEIVSLILNNTPQLISPLETIQENKHIYICFTSGTTGYPKGVVVKTKGVFHYIKSISKSLNIDHPLQYCYVSSLSTDLGNTGLFLSLFTGGTLHIIDDYIRKDAREFWNYCITNNIEFIKSTPSHFKALIRDNYKGRYKLKYLLLGGEIFEKEFACKIYNSGITENLYNHYGPTETTIGISVYKVDENFINNKADFKSVPTGVFFGNNNYNILNKQSFNIGELYITGPQVADFYYQNPEATRQMFININKQIFYKTGDLVQEHSGRVIEFLGRIDKQLKVRGYRIEPEYIEIVAKAIAEVQNAFIFTYKNKNEKIRLILALTIDQTLKDPKAIISKKLKGLLPKYMLPDEILILEKMPLKSTGKVDTQKIIQEYENINNLGFISKDITHLESNKDSLIVYKEWKHLFGSTNASDNFFELGADSIDAIEFVSRLQSFNINITAKQFLDAPTLSGIIKSIDNDSKVRKFNYDRKIDKFHPVQYWYFKNCSSFQGWFNQSIVISTQEEINIPGFQKIINSILENHPILRTKFFLENGQRVAELLESPRVEDYTAFYDIEGNEALISIIAEKHNKLISEETGLLSQFVLLRKRSNQYNLLLIIHHLAIDGVSWRILIDEIIKRYNHLQANSHIQMSEINSYTQWIEALHAYNSSEEGKNDKKYWHKSLLNIGKDNNDLSLPIDNELKNYKSIWLAFSESQTNKIERITYRLNTTLPNYILSCLADLFDGLTTKKEILIDLENHGREYISDEVDISRTLGWFTSVFPVKIPLEKKKNIIEYLNYLDSNNPKKGLTYGVLKYLEKTIGLEEARFCFNFLGKFEVDSEFSNKWSINGIYSGPCRNPSGRSIYEMIITAKIIHRKLYIDLCFNAKYFNSIDVRYHSETFGASLLESKKDTDLEKDKVHFFEDSVISPGQISYIPKVVIADERKIITNHLQKTVLLTGATGFVGAFLLKSIIESTNWNVICLLRADSKLSIEDKLLSHTNHYFPKSKIPTHFGKRITLLQGEIGTKYFGLEKGYYKKLANKVDLIINSAADVNLFKAIKAIESFNYLSVREIINFSTVGKPKTIHHISTLAIRGYVKNTDNPIKFSESDLDINQAFNNTYEESKFISEKLLKDHQSKGNEVYIYRLGDITGDSKAGIFQINADSNRIYQMFKSYLITKSIPEDMETFALTHVDQAANSIISIAKSDLIHGGTFNLDNCQNITVNDLLVCFKEAGVNIEKVSEEDYRLRMQKLDPTSDLHIKSLFWANRKKRNILIDKDKTDKILNHLGKNFTKIDSKWFYKFFMQNMPEYFYSNTEKSMKKKEILIMIFV